MFINRRDLFKHLISGSALFAASKLVGTDWKPFELPYQVRYTCTLQGGGDVAAYYAQHRSAFEDSERIAGINEEFFRSGRLLSIKRRDTDSSLTWTYTFGNRADYHAWNNRVYFGGLFSRQKFPPGLRWDYETHYVTEPLLAVEARTT